LGRRSRVQSSPYATSYSLKGTVGKSESVSVYPPTLTLDGIDRSSDFTFPSSIIRKMDRVSIPSSRQLGDFRRLAHFPRQTVEEDLSNFQTLTQPFLGADPSQGRMLEIGPNIPSRPPPLHQPKQGPS
jgi:hypothetical protein